MQPPKNRGKKREGSREQMTDENRERSAFRAKSQLRDKVIMLQADRMMTLTTQECITNRATAWKYFGRFMRVLGRRYPDWATDYVVVPELQARGAYHFHVALRVGTARPPYSSVIKIWRKVIGGLGSVKFSDTPPNVRARQVPGRIYGYLAKYMGKDFKVCGAMNAKRFEASRGIPDPIETVFYVPIGDDTPYRLAQLLQAESGRPVVTEFIRPGIIHLRTF